MEQIFCPAIVDDVWREIYEYLGPRSILFLSFTCKKHYTQLRHLRKEKIAARVIHILIDVRLDITIHMSNYIRTCDIKNAADGDQLMLEIMPRLYELCKAEKFFDHINYKTTHSRDSDIAKIVNNFIPGFYIASNGA